MPSYAFDDLSNVNAGLYTLMYPNAAAASAANLPAAAQFVQTIGRGAIDDGGGATYAVTTSAPSSTHPNSYIALQPTGSTSRYGRIIDRVLTPAQFGAYPNGMDCRQALLDLAAELQWRGGGRVEFPDNKTFNVVLPTGYQPIIFGTGSTGASALSGLKGLKMHFNGSVIDTGQTFAANQVAYGLYLLNCDNSEIELGFSQSNDRTLADDRGILGVYLQNTCRGVRADLTMIGGLGGVIAQRNASLPPEQRAREIDAVVRTADTFYPLNMQRNGDQVTAKVFSENAGRSYFVYNVSQHDVQVESRRHRKEFNDCLIKVQASASAQESVTSQIRLAYKRTNATGDAGDTASVTIQFDQTPPAPPTPVYYPGFIHDIDISLDIDQAGLTNAGSCVTFGVAGFAGVVDNTPVGHELWDVSISGRIQNLSQVYAPYLIDFFTGNTLTSAFKFGNIRAENLKATNTSGAKIAINGQGLSGRFKVTGVEMDGSVLPTNMAQGVFAEDVISTNLKTRIVVSAQPVMQTGGAVVLGAGGNSQMAINVDGDVVTIQGSVFFGNSTAPTFPTSGGAIWLPLPAGYAFQPASLGSQIGVAFGGSPGAPPTGGVDKTDALYIVNSPTSSEIRFFNPAGGYYQDNSPFTPQWPAGSYIYYELSFVKA